MKKSQPKPSAKPVPKSAFVSYMENARYPSPSRRVNADSLMSKSKEKKDIARINEQVGRAQIKYNGGNVPLEYKLNGMDKQGPTGNQRMQKARELRQSASRDSAIAVKSKPSLTPKKGAKSTKPPVNVAKTQKKIDKLMSKPKAKTKAGNAVRTIRTMSLRSKIEK